MITEKDLQDAIAECLGQRYPTTNTCINLAAFYTVKKELYGKNEQPTTSGFTSSSATVTYSSESEFGQLVTGKDSTEVFQLMDELLSILQCTNPRLYASVLRRLE